MPPQPTDGPLKEAPCAITKLCIRKPKVAKVLYKSSAQPKPLVQKRIHLTLSDWLHLHVVEWYDQNQPVSQDATVKHF
jgi:oligoendopeptidase F